MNTPKPRLVIATRNAHKTQEIREMIGDDYEVLDATDFPDLPPIEETGTTFLENATLKAVAVSKGVDGLVLSDDSGLEVDALGGGPGVYSSSYGGEEGKHARNNARLLQEMKGREGHSARFRCIMVLAKNGEVLETFQGKVDGRILDEERGEGGFGYDPLFMPTGHHGSFAELGIDVKNEISHRSRALRKAIDWLEKNR
jgi:XTP/dITP diphosphohydrolase